MVNYWIAALKEFNKNKPSWCMPRKGTYDHKVMIKIMASLKDKPDNLGSMGYPKNRPDVIKYVNKKLDDGNKSILNGVKKSTADKMMNDYYDYVVKEANSEDGFVDHFNGFWQKNREKYAEKRNPWHELPKQKRVKFQQNEAVFKRSAMKKMNDVEKELLDDIPVNERKDFIDDYIEYLDHKDRLNDLRWGDERSTFYYYFYKDGKDTYKYKPPNN